MKYDAVLFDLDGTLLDTLEDLADSMNFALGELGCPPCTLDQCRFFVGNGVEKFAVQALPADRRDAATVARCVQLMRAQYKDHWAIKTRPYDGVAEMLDGLAAAGLKMAVLSNKPDDATATMVSHFFGDERFASVCGAREGVALKPDPGAALAVAAEMRIAAEKFLYVGDTDTDMRTACGAGMYAVGAMWGFRPAAELTANGAKTLIERPPDLLRLI